MRLTLIAVGRDRAGPQRDLFELYAGRLRKGGKLGPLELKEVELSRSAGSAERRAREARLILSAVPRRARTVALDERGDTLDSAGFAARLGRWRDQGVPEAAFLIGGADGLDDSVLQRGDLVLALGPMTWPHLLVRGLLAEQLFRADCILSGHPYHRA